MCDRPKDPTCRVGAWAGATPVWAAPGRPDRLAGYRRSEVAPAHGFVDSIRVKTRTKFKQSFTSNVTLQSFYIKGPNQSALPSITI
jgi:hypothetical protein